MLAAGHLTSRRARLTALAVSPLLLTGAVTAAAPAAQAATLTQSYAYVYADRPSSSTPYTPTSRTYNTSGAANAVFRLDVGEYLVTMHGLATEPTANLGVAHVTAHGDSAAYCHLAWTDRSRTEDPKTGETTYVGISLFVDCFDNSGAHVDSEFTASWANAAGWGGGLSDFAYLTASEQRSSHEPPAGVQFNSMGQPNKVDYLGTGRYRVFLNGMGNKGLDPKAEKGHVEVTAFFQPTHRCKVAYFVTLSASTQVDVNCHNAEGALSDSLFTLTYTRDASLVWTPWGAYTWVQGAEQHPDEQWTYNPLGSPATTVRRGTGSEEGTYWVTSSMDGFMDRGNVHVTAEGPGPSYCKVVQWDAEIGIQVRCFKGSGEPARNPFLASFAL